MTPIELADIDELKKMYVDGECDEDLCKRAIEIRDGLKGATRIMGYFGLHAARDLAIKEDYFAEVIAEIRAHRHALALRAYDDHCAKNP